MYSYLELDSLRTLMLDYTTKCNALCLRCARNVDGKYLNKNMPIADMPWNIFEKFFKETINYIDRIDYCGNFGDPILHPDLIKGINWLRSIDDSSMRKQLDRDDLFIDIATNGGVNHPTWWAELATSLNGVGAVTFGIDGLEDTNEIYRRQVNWKKLMINVEAFINAGGVADWQFILFEHNIHQLKEAEELSKNMGFNKFFTIDNYDRISEDTGGSDAEAYINHFQNIKDGIGAETKKYEVTTVTNEATTNKEKNIKEFEVVMEELYDNDIEQYQQTAPIECSWWKHKKAGLLLMFNGEVWPCCHTGGMRFPKEEPWDHPDSTNLYNETHGKYGSEFNNIQHHSLNEILNHKWFNNELVKSWKNKHRLELCAVTCASIKKS